MRISPDIRFAAKCWVYSLVLPVKVLGEFVRLNQAPITILLILLTLCTSPTIHFLAKENVCYLYDILIQGPWLVPPSLSLEGHVSMLMISLIILGLD